MPETDIPVQPNGAAAGAPAETRAAVEQDTPRSGSSRAVTGAPAQTHVAATPAPEPQALGGPRAIPGYEGLQPYLDRFFRDHPTYERNVFVMMRFRSDPHYLCMFEVIENVLAEHGLEALRVDQKVYPDDDDLWDNIVIYMLGCKYGIAIFEDFDERDFNANVAIEYGFMRALNKRVLILKEQRMPSVPADITGSRFRPFDMMRVEETVRAQVEAWLVDIEVAGSG